MLVFPIENGVEYFRDRHFFFFCCPRTFSTSVLHPMGICRRPYYCLALSLGFLNGLCSLADDI
jgi:hypothetical protein